MKIESVLPRDAIPSIDDPAFAADYFGAPDDEAIDDAGIVTLDDHDGHPSSRSLVDDDYEIITF